MYLTGKGFGLCVEMNENAHDCSLLLHILLWSYKYEGPAPQGQMASPAPDVNTAVCHQIDHGFPLSWAELFKLNLLQPLHLACAHNVLLFSSGPLPAYPSRTLLPPLGSPPRCSQLAGLPSSEVLRTFLDLLLVLSPFQKVGTLRADPMSELSLYLPARRLLRAHQMNEWILRSHHE